MGAWQILVLALISGQQPAVPPTAADSPPLRGPLTGAPAASDRPPLTSAFRNQIARSQAASGQPPSIADTAPAFDLPEVSGRRLRLEDFRGKTVVLNFWAFWCDTWKAEMPHLRELAGRQEELNFRIVTISVDGTRLPEFSGELANRVPFPVALDVGGHISELYGVAHVPTVVLVDAEGRIQYSCVAWPGNQAILNRLRKLASAPEQRVSRTAAPADRQHRPRRSKRNR